MSCPHINLEICEGLYSFMKIRVASCNSTEVLSSDLGPIVTVRPPSLLKMFSMYDPSSAPNELLREEFIGETGWTGSDLSFPWEAEVTGLRTGETSFSGVTRSLKGEVTLSGVDRLSASLTGETSHELWTQFLPPSLLSPPPPLLLLETASKDFIFVR